MIYQDFHIFNGWVLLHDGDEDNVAFRVDEVIHIQFREGLDGPRPSDEPAPKVDIVTLRLRGEPFVRDIEFPAGKADEENSGGPMAWSLFDRIITHNYKPEEVK